MHVTDIVRRGGRSSNESVRHAEGAVGSGHVAAALQQVASTVQQLVASVGAFQLRKVRLRLSNPATCVLFQLCEVCACSLIRRVCFVAL